MAYTRQQFRRAVNGAAVLGWAIFVAPTVWHRPELLGLSALFGLPIAFAACWLIGAPILRRVMRRPVTWGGAALWGAVIAGAMAAVALAWGRLNGWLMSRDPDRWSQIGGGEQVQSFDGILTPYGWWVVVFYSAVFMAQGVVVALILRALIGPGQGANPTQ